VFLLRSLVGILVLPAMLVISIALKLGLPPFHSWVLRIRALIKKYTFLFITTLHKLFPLFLFIKIMIWKYSVRFILIIISLRGVIITQFKGVYFVMIISSLIHSGWILLRNVLKIRLMVLYWSAYCVLIIVMFYSLFIKTMVIRDETQSKYTRIAWLVLRGLPPFTMFWLKINIFMLIYPLILIARITLILIPVLSLVSYYRVFHLSLRLINFSKFNYLPVFLYFIRIIWF